MRHEENKQTGQTLQSEGNLRIMADIVEAGDGTTINKKECSVCLVEKECTTLPCGKCPPICIECIGHLTKKLLDAENGELSELPEDVRNQKMGKCPICMKIFIKVGSDLWRPNGRCQMCGHSGMILASLHFCMVENNELKMNGYCDNCWLCFAYPETYRFEYECNKCGKFQTIPHPMYRYQTTPDAFGTASWACHQQCGDYTYWRIKADQVAKVPNVDKPATWT